MKIIEKKIWPKYFQKVKNGTKNYELRLADFSAQDGDLLVLKEWNPETKKCTGREITKTISKVIKTNDIGYYLKEDVEKYGFQIIFFD